jgi:2-oxo-3-hexenedioate decarboxylase
MNMKINGVTAESGLSSAISGDPVISVMQLSDLLAKRDQFIPAGCFVLAGAATAAVNLEVGMHISLDVKSLASTNIKVEK